MIRNKKTIYDLRSAFAAGARGVPQIIFAVILGLLIGLFASTGTTRAQGSSKDDVVFDANGRPMAGAPGPPTAQDTVWTNNQRQKGPIPYVDFTAFMPAGGCNLTTSFVAPTVAMSSGSATVTLSSAQDFKNGCGIMVEGAGPTSRITQPSAPTVVSHITGGSTTIRYAVVWVDNNEGYSQASATTSFSTSDAYANLNIHHYNYITVATASSGAIMGCVYSDKGTGGSLTPIGCAPVVHTNPPYTTAQFGFIDWGKVLPTPGFLPANPPGAAGPEALFTTITSGGGTNTLKLAGTASNSVSGTTAYHDESSFLVAAGNYLPSIQNTGYPCNEILIPQGDYYLAHWPTMPAFIQYVIELRGRIWLADLPLYKPAANWVGPVAGGSATQFGTYGVGFIKGNTHLPAIIISGAWNAENIEITSVQGDGVDYTQVGGSGGGRWLDVDIVENSSGVGCPLHFDGNSIGFYADYFVPSASNLSDASGAICFNNLTQSVGDAQIFFRNG